MPSDPDPRCFRCSYKDGCHDDCPVHFETERQHYFSKMRDERPIQYAAQQIIRVRDRRIERAAAQIRRVA